jgi:hypothetical protein
VSRAGGESAKYGDWYESVWTVDKLLDIVEKRYRAIKVEAMGDESIGVEFELLLFDGSKEFHSVKRQKQGESWTIYDLSKKDQATGRSILGDLLAKIEGRANSQVRFVSSTGANVLREMSENAASKTDSAHFERNLNAKPKADFGKYLLPLCNNDNSLAFEFLKRLEVILRTHKDLIRTVEQRIDGLFYRLDNSDLLAGDIRSSLAEFILGHLDVNVERDHVLDFLKANGIGLRDWKIDQTVNDSIAKLNQGFLRQIENDLINSTHIERDVASKVADVLTKDSSQGALLISPAGHGKSCVLTQCLKRFDSQQVRYLGLRFDAVSSCQTTKQLGKQFDLPASPAVVLAGIADNSRCVLVIDQLDAMSLVSGRNPQLWNTFQELCDEVSQYPQMRLLLACRKFDLENDHRLRKLGADKSGFDKFEVGLLSETEVRESLKAAGFDHAKIGQKQLEILRVPVHLHLYLQGDPGRDFHSLSDLYERYWTRKKHNLRERLGRACNWNQVLDALMMRMSEELSVVAPKIAAANWESDAKAMVSEHVLVEVPEQKAYRFFHESFFDYAYARRFCENGHELASFLKASEQHLFRRSQVRQVLSYRRENDFWKYLSDLREVLSDPGVRFHIKRMVVAGLKLLAAPRQEEWEVIQPYLLKSPLSGFANVALRDHVGWFDLFESLGVLKGWLASPDASLNDLAIWFVQTPELQKHRSSKVAGMIRPYLGTSDEWNARILRVLSWDCSHESPEMSNVFLECLRRGYFDNYESGVHGADFWTQFHSAQRNAPRFVIDVLAIWFERVAKRCDDGKSSLFFDKCSQNRSQSGALHVGKIAVEEPTYFLEKMLPLVRDIVSRTKIPANESFRCRAWPWLSNQDYSYKVSDAVLLGLRKALSLLGKSDPLAFREHAKSLATETNQVFAVLLMRSWAKNPIEFADDCARYLLSDKRLLDVGYSGWTTKGGDNEGTGECAITRVALQAISPHCSVAHLRKIESAILEFEDDFEKSYPQCRGFKQLVLLLSLDASRTSEVVKGRICELQQLHGGRATAIVKDDTSPLLSAVGSPISDSVAAQMTDEEWIAAMLRYDKDDRDLKGGIHELSHAVRELARKDRARFAALISKMPIEIHADYFSAILDGICSQWTRLNADEKTIDDAEVAEFSTEKFTEVIEKLHELPNKPCGSAICDCARKLASRELPASLLKIVSYYALHAPDPTADIWKASEHDPPYYGGDPHGHGINTTRGKAALAIAELLFANRDRFE